MTTNTWTGADLIATKVWKRGKVEKEKWNYHIFSIFYTSVYVEPSTWIEQHSWISVFTGMITFAGILGRRQLLNLANDCEKKQKIIQHPSEINVIQQHISLSSVSVSSSYCLMQNTNFMGKKSEDLDEIEEYDHEEKRIKEKTIVTYCDAMGNIHHGVKLNKKQQKMNGRSCYTPTMICAYPGCMKATHVTCYQCHAPFCYPLMNFVKEKEELDICFVKHVECIVKKRNKNRLVKMNGE